MNSTSYPSSYSPSDLVKEVHNYPHLDSSLSPVSNDFNITYQNFDDLEGNDYLKSLFPFPIIVTVCTVVVILLFSIALTCRLCCNICKCCYKLETVSFNSNNIMSLDPEGSLTLTKERPLLVRALYLTFLALTVGIFVLDFASVGSSVRVTDG